MIEFRKYTRRSLLLLILGIFMGLPSDVCGYQSVHSSPNRSMPAPADSLLQMEEYEAYPEADYFYSLKKADIRFNRSEGTIKAIINYFVRIKVLDEAVTQEAALVDIPYYFDQQVEQIRRIEGTTYQPDGTSDDLDTSDIRTINVNRRYNVKEFNMPSVKAGSVLQYRYTMVRKYIEELPDFYFAHQVPTLKAQLILNNPRYLRYDAVPLMVDGQLRHTSHTMDTSSVPKIFTVPQPAPVLVERWTAQNVAPVKPRPFLPEVDEYRGRIKFQISEFGLPRQPLENSWELVAAKIRRNRNPLKVLEQSTSTDSIISGVKSKMRGKEAVQDSLFRLVNQRMRYNGQTAISSDKSVEDVLSGEPVDQAAINQTLLKLLREAGIKRSWPVLISTREHGQINRSFPSPFQFNAMMILTEIDGKTFWMDASYSHSRPGLIPISMNNREGMVLKRNKNRWIDVKPSFSENDLSLSVNGALQRSGDLSFRLKGQASGYPARHIRKQQKEGESPDEIIRDSFFQGYSDVVIKSVDIRKRTDYRKPLEVRVRAEIAEYGQSYRSGVKYNPMVLGPLMENPFKAEERKLPVILDAPEQLNFSYRIDIPENASVDSTHANQIKRIADGSLKESYQLGNDSLIYNYEIRMSGTHYNADQYPQIRSLYQRWVELSQQDWFIELKGQ